MASQAATAGTGATPRTEKVATGPARSLGEPAAAQDAAASAVAATTFGARGTLAAVWTRRAGAKSWTRAGSILPAGFGSSYDPAAAAAPGGPLLVVAGTAPPGENCITNGSVAIASVDSRGRLGTARLVSDQRGTGSFDDRPALAVGQHGTVWVAWSQGPSKDACQNVGSGDRIEVARSGDGGRTFGAPVALPADGGHSAFGVRLAPLSGGQLAVSWTETMSTGDLAVLVSVLGPAGQPGPVRRALAGAGLPLVLPGASFYDFPAGDLIALPDGRLVVAAPFWVAGRSVIKRAVGVPGGRWRATELSPPAGRDLLLPALGLLSPGDVRLLCAVHTRLGDRLRYDWAKLSVAGPGVSVAAAGLTALTPAPAGPGFFEIGEELSLTRTPDGLIAAFVVGGNTGATLEVARFPAPPAAVSPDQASTPGRGQPASGQAADAGRPGSAHPALWTGAVAVCCVAVLGTWLARRRRIVTGRHARS